MGRGDGVGQAKIYDDFFWGVKHHLLKVLDNEENEKKISDLIIETRASVNKFKIRNQVHIYRVSIGYGA
jgi:hypothetical protein